MVHIWLFFVWGIGRNGQFLCNALVYLSRSAALTGMTQVAVFYRPGEDAVMAGAAILPVYDLDHVDIISARLELEAEIAMAHFAGEADAVKPVREYHGPDILYVSVVVDDHIAVFGLCDRVASQGTG